MARTLFVNGSLETTAKGWVDCKTGKPCGRQRKKNAELSGTDQLWRNVTSAAKKKKSSKRISWKASSGGKLLEVLISKGEVS